MMHSVVADVYKYTLRADVADLGSGDSRYTFAVVRPQRCGDNFGMRFDGMYLLKSNGRVRFEVAPISY